MKSTSNEVACMSNFGLYNKTSFYVRDVNLGTDA